MVIYLCVRNLIHSHFDVLNGSSTMHGMIVVPISSLLVLQKLDNII